MKLLKNSLLTFIPLTLAAALISTSALAGDSTAGKVVYDGKGACASCHGVAGAGDGHRRRRPRGDPMRVAKDCIVPHRYRQEDRNHRSRFWVKKVPLESVGLQ